MAPYRINRQIALLAASVLASLPCCGGVTVTNQPPRAKSLLGRALSALRSETFDPADPTQINTSAGVAALFNTIRTPEGAGLTYGSELNLAYVLDAFSDYSIGLDLPLLQSDLPGNARRFGLGDLTINNLYIPYRSADEGARFLGAGAQLPVTVPTGAFEAGLGEGNWGLTPGLLVGVRVGSFRLYPILTYRFTVEGRGEVGLDRSASSEGPGLDLVLTGGLPDPWYVVLTPHYAYDRRAESDPHTLDLTVQVGRMLGSRFNQSLGLSATQELLDRPGPQSSFRLSYAYYF